MKIIYWLMLVCSAFPMRAAEAVWLTDVQTALAKARAENKKVLVDFTGSDWCGWCIRLKKEVFDQPEFVAYAREKLVLVEVDFPHNKWQSRTLKSVNEALAKEYKVQGFPTIFLLDANGNKLLRDGYQSGGASNYIALLEQLDQPSSAPAAAQENPAPTAPPKPFTWPAQTAPVIRYTNLTLKGITGRKDRRFALINNQTLGIGERAKVKLGDAQIEVLCQEIRDDSVLIKVEDEAEPKELRLKN